ncbi:MAG TPA: hypothetical protein VMU87_00080 [Stellaceae bacterium]|nr:hypothetical protein [Stellaceae bacterium]
MTATPPSPPLSLPQLTVIQNAPDRGTPGVALPMTKTAGARAPGTAAPATQGRGRIVDIVV